MEKIKENRQKNLAVSESTVTSVCNKIIDILNQEQIKFEETVVVLAQILIYAGKSISLKDIDFDNTSWEDLEKEYYSNNKENDIGLGLILNGGSIMQALNVEIINDLNKGKDNVQVSTTRKIPQKNSSAANRSKASSRKSR